MTSRSKVDLRKYARSKPCMIRLPGCIDGPDHETTVLCHWRDSSTGMGQKSSDLLGAWGCAHCHDVVDGRKKLPEDSIFDAMFPSNIKICFMNGIVRTLIELVKAGIIKW